MDSDSSYPSGNDDSVDDPNATNLPLPLPQQLPPVAENLVGNSSRTAKSTPPYVLPQDRRACSNMRNEVSKRIKGAPIDTYTSLRIIRKVLELQDAYLQALAKKGTNKKGDVKPPALRKTVCEFFAISEHTFAKVMSSYFTENRRKRSVYSSVAGEAPKAVGKGNRSVHVTRLPRNETMRVFVQQFVRQKRVTRERVTATQVLQHLIESGKIEVPVGPDGLHPKKPYDSALRAVRRFLSSFGYRRGQRTGNIVQKQSVILARDTYLVAFTSNRELPQEDRLREVFLDESYIHQHYKSSDDSVCDPNDNQDIQIGKSINTGSGYCFMAAIQGPDPRVAVPTNNNQKAGLVPGTVWAFCPQRKRDRHGDCHKVFNSTNFVNWWRTQLMPNLHQPSVIYMDDAAYHKTLPPDTPKTGTMKKIELIDFLRDRDIHFDPRSTTPQLRQRARQWVVQNVAIEVVQVAAEHGHKVVFTAPYHSDLQPIELVWALIKGNVGQQYSLGTSLDLVYERLMAEFAKLEDSGHDLVLGMIEKCAKLTNDLYVEIQNEEENNEDGKENGNNSDRDGSEALEDDSSSDGDSYGDFVGPGEHPKGIAMYEL